MKIGISYSDADHAVVTIAEENEHDRIDLSLLGERFGDCQCRVRFLEHPDKCGDYAMVLIFDR